MRQIEEEILKAHDRGDAAALARLYLTGAEHTELNGEIDAACFLYTTAYVFALEAGDETIAAAARQKLVNHGREL